MSKYSFARMEPEDFESMAQSLLESTYRAQGNLIQFGDGQDGGREATWSQPPNHPQYSRPANEESDIDKEWVFQVKYHDIEQRGWSTARNAVVNDLSAELEKIINKYDVPCHAYVMITNVPFTGVRNVGTRDRVTEIANKWKEHIPEIYIWDAADLSRMLDANEDVRTGYEDTILVGDMIKALRNQATFRMNRQQSAFKAYLKFVTEREEFARAEEAGDEPNLSLAKVFIDLTLKIQDSSNKLPIGEWLSREFTSKSQANKGFVPKNLTKVKTSFALFFADYPYILLLGGPGLGKSTLTQFLSLYQAARIVKPDLSVSLAERLKLPEGKTTQDLDAYCRPRFPFRIELRRYAKWMSDSQNNQHELARYVVEVLINANASSTLDMDDVFDLASKNPILLILDGLDEVPNTETRRQIIENLQVFLRRIDSEDGDIQVILSSRPKGYSGEFEGFEPITWELNELERENFDEYCNCWLENRIRDAEERCEAQERIERGMRSEAVQRLARSLLQATVILTIVRNKDEIPHQRNSLYEQYVKVIFAREKLKSPIVSKHEKALLQLHYKVGYELHRKMERTNIEALDRETFRNYILNVLEDYSGNKLGNNTLRGVANEIIEATTDRLCLLIGKGKDQTDVDFVVQQYREYFAALYLSNHPDADPERVFDMLVQRGAYWAYVLQFYVAQANANQQMRWITDTSDQDEEKSSFEAIVRKTRTYRAILNVLPEFTCQRNKDFNRIFKIIFSSETRWTWLEQKSAIEILQLIPSTNIFQTLWKIFGNLSLEDNTALAVELWLLIKLSSPQSQYRENICHKIQSLVQQEEIQESALLSAIQNDLKVDLINCNISKVARIFESYVYEKTRRVSYNKSPKLSNFLSYQSKEKQCELLLFLGLGSWGFRFNFPFLSQSSEAILFPEDELRIFKSELGLKFMPFLLRNIIHLNDLALVSKCLDGIDSLHAKYLRILLQAIQEPTNEDLDNEARVIESQLSENISYLWKTDFFLGPPVSAFSSVEAWQEFKQKITDFSINEPQYIANIIDFNESQYLWLCLLFHPDHWSLLLRENIIQEEEFNKLITTSLADILKIPTIPLDIFQSASISPSSEAATEIPLHKVLHVILNIIEKEGIERVSKARSVIWLLMQCRITKSANTKEVEKLLRQANKLPSFPSIWVSAILKLCLNTSELDIDLLLDFWEKNENLAYIYCKYELINAGTQLVERLLENSRSSALRLSTVIAASAELNKKIQDSLRERLLAESNKYLNSDDLSYRLYCQALLNLDPSLEEFPFWKQPEATNRMIKFPWLLDRLRNRFDSLAEPVFQINHEQLRQRLSIFIENQHDYPATIALGALEAMLKIDELDLPALENSIWQQYFDD